MNTNEIKHLCEQALKPTGDGKIRVLVPGQWPTTGNRRLFTGCGPEGELIRQGRDAAFAAFDAKGVLATLQHYRL